MNPRTLPMIAMVAMLQVAVQASDMQKICDYIKADDRTSLRNALDENDVDLRREYSDIKCGKYPLLRYAVVSGALEAASLIISKGGKKILSEKDADGLAALDYAKKHHDSADAASKPKVKAVLDLIQSKS
ncbi:DUF3718 domain-containing protein [Chitinimonas sp. BJYL2]|uniref:DUF3718 domain-containing protein n=1 Tax=Chitinimonas sp. BJYL2 TaxID=2976696 RepID=UPI0022B2AD23|nr:DUF3718 domain-containing protein [Chitinimonas sp. BJYL2]